MPNILETIQRLKQEEQEKERKRQISSEEGVRRRKRFLQEVEESGVREEMETISKELVAKLEKAEQYDIVWVGEGEDPFNPLNYNPEHPDDFGLELVLVWGRYTLTKNIRSGFAKISRTKAYDYTYQIRVIPSLKEESLFICGEEVKKLLKKDWASPDRELIQNALAEAFLHPSFDYNSPYYPSESY